MIKTEAEKGVESHGETEAENVAKHLGACIASSALIPTLDICAHCAGVH